MPGQIGRGDSPTRWLLNVEFLVLSEIEMVTYILKKSVTFCNASVSANGLRSNS